MTIQRLREIAEYHADIAAKEARLERRLYIDGRCNSAIKHADSSIHHANIANDLRQLATAFETLTPILTSQK